MTVHESKAREHAERMFAKHHGRRYACVWAGGLEWLFERTDDGFRLKSTRPVDTATGMNEGREFPSWDAAR